MEWPPLGPYLNPTENLGSIEIIKLKWKQYNSKADWWESIKTNISETEPAEVKKQNVTKWMYYWLRALIEKKDH